MNSHRASLSTRVTAVACAALLIPSHVISSTLPPSTGRDEHGVIGGENLQ
jgi:hypothetical protein